VAALPQRDDAAPDARSVRRQLLLAQDPSKPADKPAEKPQDKPADKARRRQATRQARG